MHLLDGRRLTGRSPWAEGPAAAVVVRAEAAAATGETGASDASPAEDAAAAFAAWTAQVAATLAHLGWPPARFRRVPAGADEVWTASAPIDRLYAVLAIAEAAVDGHAIPALAACAAAAEDAAGDPALLALQARAQAASLPLLWDDDAASVGLGARGRCWPRDALRALGAGGVAALDLGGVGAVPVALITGTNGKTTTTRLLAKMAHAAGLRAGATSTAGLAIDGTLVEAGDWTGPGGARALLRDPRVELAVLEAARGGMLRRGLALARVDVAAVTNVSADHLGEWGIDAVEAMAAVKLLVADTVAAGGRLVYVDDSHRGAVLATALRHRQLPAGVELLRVAPPGSPPSTAPGRRAAWVDADAIVIDDGHGPALRVPLAEVPITIGGRARHNAENAMVAALLARGLGLPDAAIAEALRTFRPDAADSAGRCNLLDLRGATILLDFGHNPDGVRAMAELAAALPATRRLCILGQAGDRSDADIRGLIDALHPGGFERWLLKDMEHYARGRPPGEVVAILAGALHERGVAPAAISRHASEDAATQAALVELRPGELLLLLAHEDAELAMRRCLEAGALPWAGDVDGGG